MLAVAAGVATTVISGVVGLAIAVAGGRQAGVTESTLRMTQIIFAVYVSCGLLLCVGGWRLLAGDPRGLTLTRFTALFAALLTALCLTTSLVGRGTFDYSLMCLTIPLVTYAAILYAMRPKPATRRDHDLDP